MLNISTNPYKRLKDKLNKMSDSTFADLFEIKNEVFIAYCEEIPIKEIFGAIDDHICSEKIRNDLRKYLKKIVEKGADRYDRRRRKKNDSDVR